jgi:Family of unknown function (DUF6252)
MKNKLIVSILLLAVLVSCKKEVTELPDPTQSGSNTFGAKVNGQLWAPQGFGPIPASNLLEARFIGNDLIIKANNFASSPNETGFEIRVMGVTDIGTYSLNTTITHPSFAASYAYYVKRNLTPQNEWVTSASSTGTITFSKVDRTNGIVSGTFQFNALNLYNTPEPLAVTEGRFDIKLQ